MMGWTPPMYIHTSTIDKIDSDTGKQRKLSKRHDPEANVAYFLRDGWPTEAVLEYLGNIAASGYEEAKNKGQVKSIWEYPLRPKKIPISGALFDMKKLEWWAREFIATMSVDELVQRVRAWANSYDLQWAARIAENPEYLKIFCLLNVIIQSEFVKILLHGIKHWTKLHISGMIYLFQMQNMSLIKNCCARF